MSKYQESKKNTKKVLHYLGMLYIFMLSKVTSISRIKRKWF